MGPNPRTFSGTIGTLAIGEASIRFVSDKSEDSRTWLYRDIETIGRPDSFRFRVTPNWETYVLELKENFPEAAYGFAWSRCITMKGAANDLPLAGSARAQWNSRSN
jgi:hypothetical protein